MPMVAARPLTDAIMITRTAEDIVMAADPPPRLGKRRNAHLAVRSIIPIAVPRAQQGQHRSRAVIPDMHRISTGTMTAVLASLIVADDSLSPERHIWACANMLLLQHGNDAWFHAARRADELLAAGDLEGYKTFSAILDRIKQLEALEPTTSLQ
jgi:hypothetical protein